MTSPTDLLTEIWGSGYHSLCSATNGTDFGTVGVYDNVDALLERSAEVNAKRKNVWFGVHPMAVPPEKRGGNDAVSEVRVLPVDCDWKAAGAHVENDKLPTEDEVRAAFAKLDNDLRPSFVVNSGFGFHGYWLLDSPVTPTIGAELIARLHAALAALGLDTDREDLASVLRVPGSMNWKTGEPVEVVIEEFHPNRRYGPEYLAERLPKASAGATGSGPGKVKERGFEKVMERLIDADRDQDAEALRVLCECYGGHHPFIAGDNSVSVCRPGKTAGTSASIGYSSPGVIVMFTSAWTHNGTTFTKKNHYIVEGTKIVDADDFLFGDLGGSSPLDVEDAHLGAEDDEDLGAEDDEDLGAGRSGTTSTPPKSWAEAHVAELLAGSLRGRYLWSRKLGWLRWDGRRWATDENERVLEDVRRWVIRLGRRIMATATVDDLKAVASYKQVGRLNNLATLARRMDGIAVEPDQLDAHPGLLNCRNGIVDLRTGDLAPHDPLLYLTKLAGADYRPDAAHPDVEIALTALDDGPRAWVQRFFGHASTGEASEDIVAVWDGAGGNSKTTILHGARAALGDYARPIARELIMRTTREEHPTAYAELYKVRLAFIEELPEDGVLRVEVLKTLSGGGEVRARYMHKDAWSFQMTHSLLIATNHRPRVFTLEDAIWRRLRLVPFPYRYSGIGDEQRPGDRIKDLGLRERVRRGTEQREAFLAWIVAGARQWYANGIGHNPDVAAATRQWKMTEDVIGAFMAEYLVPAIDREVNATHLYDRYKKWSTDQGHKPMSNTLFGQRFCDHPTCIEHKIVKRHTSTGNVYDRVRFRGDLDDVYDWNPNSGAHPTDRETPGGEGYEGSYVNRSRDSSSERFTPNPSYPSQTACLRCRLGTVDEAGFCSERNCEGF